MVKFFVTGGAGFVGSNLVDRLINEGNLVTVYDNLVPGSEELIKHNFDNPSFKLVKADVADLNSLKKALKGHDFVFHLAANPDVAKGAVQTDLDLRQGVMLTYNVLEAMRTSGVRKIAYASSSTVYGEKAGACVSEDFGPLLPVSLYGAAKLASEGLISAFSHMFDIRAWIFRPANIIGRNSTHGVIFDFIKKLRKNPRELEILGDGTQRKSYIHVKDAIDAMLFAIRKSNDRLNLFNIGSEDFIDVKSIADIIVSQMGLNAKYKFTGGNIGWKGDVPKMILDVTKIKKLGWMAKLTSKEAVEKTVSELLL